MFWFLLIPFFAQAEVSFSGTADLIQRIQSKFLSHREGYPIVIFDRNEIEWRFAQAHAFGKPELRTQIIIQTVQEKSGVLISTNDASNFDTYLTVLKDSAVSLPAFSNGLGSPISMCAVFPGNDNSNQRLETDRILQFPIKEAYGDLNYNRLKRTLSYSQMQLISLLHEMSHCLDKTYLPKVYQGYSDAHSIHQGEAFAETLAILLAAQEGEKNIGPVRAEHRTIYSRYIEDFFSHNPNKGMGDENFIYGGIIYYLAPVIEAAQLLVDKDKIQSASLSDLINIAGKIVEEKSISPRAFYAIYSAFTDGRQTALTLYKERAESAPNLFQKAYEDLVQYFQISDPVILDAFYKDDRVIPSKQKLLPYSATDFCPAFRSKNYGDFFMKLNIYRTDLAAANGTADEQKFRAEELKGLLEFVSYNCN